MPGICIMSTLLTDASLVGALHLWFDSLTNRFLHLIDTEILTGCPLFWPDSNPHKDVRGLGVHHQRIH